MKHKKQESLVHKIYIRKFMRGKGVWVGLSKIYLICKIKGFKSWWDNALGCKRVQNVSK